MKVALGAAAAAVGTATVTFRATAVALGTAAFAFGAAPAVAATSAASAPARPFAVGDRVAAPGLVTQDARPFRFDDGTGRAVALSFVYTNCRDADGCPAVSARFAKLQARIDPARVRLVLVTIAPREDTPPVLRRYAAAYRADAKRWTFVTGDPRSIAVLAERFSIAGAQRDPDGALDHAERLIVLDGSARIADTIPGANWSPDDALAVIDPVAGLADDPLRRAAVHLTWAFEHTCSLPRTNAATSLHHAGIALLLLIPPGPLLGMVLAETHRRKRRIREPDERRREGGPSRIRS